MKIHKFILLTLLMCLSIYACKKNEPTQQGQEPPQENKISTQNLIGEWIVVGAEMNGGKLNSIQDAIFTFNKDNTLIFNGNIPGINNGEATPYELNDLTISKVGSFELDFEIITLTEKSMLLESKIQGIDFVFELKK